MTAEKRAEPTPGYSPEPWTTDPRHAHEALLDADGSRVADFHIFGRTAINNHANARRVIDTAAKRDRLKTANAVLVAGLEELETFAPWGGRTQKDIWAFQKWAQKIATTTLAKAKESTP